MLGWAVTMQYMNDVVNSNFLQSHNELCLPGQVQASAKYASVYHIVQGVLPWPTVPAVTTEGAQSAHKIGS